MTVRASTGMCRCSVHDTVVRNCVTVGGTQHGGIAVSQGGSVLCLAGRSVRKLQDDQIVFSSLWWQQP